LPPPGQNASINVENIGDRFARLSFLCRPELLGADLTAICADFQALGANLNSLCADLRHL
jgi:hypothetical protein